MCNVQKKNPIISVITVCYNSEKTIEKTIKSVINQNYDNLQYIIVDGLSTDNTLEIIQKYMKQDKRISLISEKDNGIYDAMNKGIMLAEGTWINFMNSGDCFADDNVIKNLCEDDNDDFDLIYGNTVVVNDKEKIKIKKYPLKLKLTFFYVDMINHQSVFIKRNVFEEIGLYNLKEKIYADYEHMLRMFKNKRYKFKYIDKNVAVFSKDGVSSKVKVFNVFYKRGKIVYELFGKIHFLLYGLSWLVIKPIVKIRNM